MAALDVAATKLLSGLQPSDLMVYWDHGNVTLSGVASVLCRTGLRPRSSSPLASQLVADFMGVLSYRDDVFVSGFASEPMLAFGAAWVWYAAAKTHENHHVVLEKKLLPKLRELVAHKVLEMDDVGLVVARIVLLLAIDTVSAVASDGAASSRVYRGQLFPVWDFLDVLSDPNHQDERNTTLRDDIRIPWRDWRVGFGQFVQLETEPTLATLWWLLARRAAGIFPRAYNNDVGFVIPMLKDGQNPKVSMILVALKNCARTSTARLTPATVFRGALQDLSPSNVILVTMHVRDTTPCDGCHVENDSSWWSLCVQGLVTSRPSKNPALMFLSDGIVDELKKLLRCSWEDYVHRSVREAAALARSRALQCLVEKSVSGS